MHIDCDVRLDRMDLGPNSIPRKERALEEKLINQLRNLLPDLWHERTVNIPLEKENL